MEGFDGVRSVISLSEWLEFTRQFPPFNAALTLTILSIGVGVGLWLRSYLYTVARRANSASRTDSGLAALILARSVAWVFAASGLRAAVIVVPLSPGLARLFDPASEILFILALGRLCWELAVLPRHWLAGQSEAGPEGWREHSVGWIRTVIGLIFGVLALYALAGEVVSILLTIGGFVLVVFGLAFRDLVDDCASGLALRFSNTYDVGSIVEVEGMAGAVEHVGLFRLVLLQEDGSRVSLPNRWVASHAVRIVGEVH